MKKIFGSIFAPIVTLVACVFVAITVRGWNDMGWIIASTNWAHYLSNFDFTSGNIDTWLVMIPVLIGGALFALALISSIMSHEWLRLALAIFAAVVTLVATYLYSSAPAPITWLPGLLSYVALLGGLTGQFLLIRRFER